MASKESILSQERLKELLHYDPIEGVFTSAVQRGKLKAGDVVGTTLPGRRPYRIINIADRPYRAHRLAWLYMTGNWPAGQVDHIDNDGLNNAWRNLRECTQSENQRNRSCPKGSLTGVKGVRKVASTGRYSARIHHHNREHHLGTFDTLEAARQARNAKATELHGEFMRR